MVPFRLPDGPPSFSAWFLDKVVTAARDSFTSLARAVTNDHVMPASLLAAAPVRIKHGLGALPSTWEIVDKNAQADVWRVSMDTTWITLAASADVFVKVRVT